MSDIDNVRSGTLLALTNRGEGRSCAACALRAISVGTRASAAYGARCELCVDNIWLSTLLALTRDAVLCARA
jgi:hypothetical protein